MFHQAGNVKWYPHGNALQRAEAVPRPVVEHHRVAVRLVGPAPRFPVHGEEMGAHVAGGAVGALARVVRMVYDVPCWFVS